MERTDGRATAAQRASRGRIREGRKATALLSALRSFPALVPRALAAPDATTSTKSFQLPLSALPCELPTPHSPLVTQESVPDERHRRHRLRPVLWPEAVQNDVAAAAGDVHHRRLAGKLLGAEEPATEERV